MTPRPVGWVKPTLKPRTCGCVSTNKRGFHAPHRLLAAATLAILTFALPHTAHAQDCEKALADLRWTLVEPNSSWQLASDHAGAVLLDMECDPEFIKEWFAAAAWKLVGESTRKLNETGPFGPTNQRFRIDQSMAFCLPRQWPWRWITEGCSVGIGISTFQGRITHINAGAYE